MMDAAGRVFGSNRLGSKAEKGRVGGVGDICTGKGADCFNLLNWQAVLSFVYEPVRVT
jgi:hypothetical protein